MMNLKKIIWLAIPLALNGCTLKKGSKVNIEFLLTQNIEDHFKNNRYANIAFSDSAILFYQYLAAHSDSNFASPKLSMWKDGKPLEIDKYLNKTSVLNNEQLNVPYEQILSNYHLKSYRIKDFFQIDNFEYEESVSDTLKNGLVVKYSSDSSDAYTLSLISANKVNNYVHKNTFFVSSLGSLIKLYDIDGDGLEEIFVVQMQGGYWNDGLNYLIDIYKIKVS